MQRGDERPRKMLRSQQPPLNVNKTKEIIVDFRKSTVFRNCSSSHWKPLQCRLLSMLFPPKQCLKKVSNRMKDNALAFSFFFLSSFWEKPLEYVHSWTTGPENNFFPQAIMLLNCFDPPYSHPSPMLMYHVLDIKSHTEEFISGLLYMLRLLY